MSVFAPQLTINPSSNVEKQTFHSIQSLLSFAVRAKIWIYRSRDLTWLLTVSSKRCRIAWQRDKVSTKHICTFLLRNIAYPNPVWRLHSICVYHMNYGYYSVFDKYTPLVLSHRKFTTDKPLSLWARGLSVASFLWPRTRVVYMSNTPSSSGLYIYIC